MDPSRLHFGSHSLQYAIKCLGFLLPDHNICHSCTARFVNTRTSKQDCFIFVNIMLASCNKKNSINSMSMYLFLSFSRRYDCSCICMYEDLRGAQIWELGL